MTSLHAWPWKVKTDSSTKYSDNIRFIIRWGHLWPFLLQNYVLLKKAKLSEVFARKLAWDSLFKIQVCTLEHKLLQNRALKWDIVCFSSIFGSHTISLQSRKKWKFLIKILAKSCMMARHKEDLPSHETITTGAKTLLIGWGVKKENTFGP